MPATITITYPDGRKENINVVNADHVRRVARAGRVMRPWDSGLSASYPQAAQPHDVSTSSLPASLGQTSSLPASLAPGAPEDVDDDGTDGGNQSSQVVDPAVGQQHQQSSPPEAEKSAVKEKKKKQKYQSHSAPTITIEERSSHPQQS